MQNDDEIEEIIEIEQESSCHNSGGQFTLVRRNGSTESLYIDSMQCVVEEKSGIDPDEL